MSLVQKEKKMECKIRVTISVPSTAKMKETKEQNREQQLFISRQVKVEPSFAFMES